MHIDQEPRLMAFWTWARSKKQRKKNLGKVMDIFNFDHVGMPNLLDLGKNHSIIWGTTQKVPNKIMDYIPLTCIIEFKQRDGNNWNITFTLWKPSRQTYEDASLAPFFALTSSTFIEDVMWEFTIKWMRQHCPKRC